MAKKLDGQRYPMPLGQIVRGAVAPRGPMTYALAYREGIMEHFIVVYWITRLGFEPRG